MKKKMILTAGSIIILAVSVWGCIEECIAKKQSWETAAVPIRITTGIAGNDGNLPSAGALHQTAVLAFQDFCGLLDIADETSHSTPDYPAMIMVENLLYFDSGEISMELRCGMMDGSISSVTEGVPTQNNQSNFGTGYGYQYGMGTIEVYIDDEWHIFIPYDTPSHTTDWDNLSEEERMELDPTYFGE